MENIPKENNRNVCRGKTAEGWYTATMLKHLKTWLHYWRLLEPKIHRKRRYFTCRLRMSQSQ